MKPAIAGNPMSKDTANYTEKRELVRMRISTPAQINMTDNTGTISAVCKELSGTGMQVASEQAIEVGTTIEITIPANKEGLEPFHASAEVIRSSGEEGNYTLALKINEIH
jgi:c-di-GMP-binding flagellar brake protein YcgR